MNIQNTSFLPSPNAPNNNARTNALVVEPKVAVDTNPTPSTNPTPAITLRSLESQANRVFASGSSASANETFSASRDNARSQNARTQDALNQYQQFENFADEENRAQIRQLFGVDVFA